MKLGAPPGSDPVKGLALVLHAVAVLRPKAVDVELRDRGSGPRARPRSALLARSLGHRGARDVSRRRRATWRRSTRSIDCLLHRRSPKRSGSSRSKRPRTAAPSWRRAIDGLARGRRGRRQRLHRADDQPLERYVELGGGSTDCRSASTTLRATRSVPRRRRSRALGRGGRCACSRDARGFERLSAARERSTCSRSSISTAHVGDVMARHRWLHCDRIECEPAGADRVTVVLYRPSLDARSGAGQLLRDAMARAAMPPACRR